ncbi:MAG TPA: sensor histidine kinase [Planctomycetota bacterium]|nr:sensor histidine kinase [Planctomycetota bacterium]
MKTIRESPWWRYGVAVLATGVVTALTILIHAYLSHGVMALFIASVMISAWYGGLGPGLLASVLSSLACQFFFFPPIYSLAVEASDDIAQIVVFAIVTVLITTLTHSQKKSLEALVESKRRLQEYAESVWEQHRRFSSELHDSLGQELTGLGFLSKSLTQSMQGTEGAAKAEQVKLAVERALEQIRGLAKGVMPVEREADGLMSALEQLARNISSVYGISCTFVHAGPVLLDDHTNASQLFRIAQEAITNAMKHAKPRSVTVSLEKNEDGIALKILDDGVGIPDAPEKSGKGSGLSIMKYRAAALGATLRIERNPPGGTLVSCFLPQRRSKP